MNRESGCKNSPIWLLGDSNPKGWAKDLDVPLDPRHPARHNIWTPILEGIQECVFLSDRLRVDTSRFYTRNAVQNADIRLGSGRVEWTPELNQEISCYSELLRINKPRIVFSFGAFAFEFARRSLQKGLQPRGVSHWSVKRLGEEFRVSTDNFDRRDVNIVPLLHAVIARQFQRCHEDFTDREHANYFSYTACKIAELLVEHQKELDIWVPQ